jgi:hypothetical protein
MNNLLFPAAELLSLNINVTVIMASPSASYALMQLEKMQVLNEVLDDESTE